MYRFYTLGSFNYCESELYANFLVYEPTRFGTNEDGDSNISSSFMIGCKNVKWILKLYSISKLLLTIDNLEINRGRLL